MTQQIAAKPQPRRTLRTIVTVGVTLALAVTAVVVALYRFTADEAIAEQCTATHGSLSWSLSPEQADNAALIQAIAIRRGLPTQAVTIGIATALQESRLMNIDYGDRDSVGIFQQRPSQGWGTVAQIMDPVYSTNAFYDVLVTVDNYQNIPVTDAAQQVQRSAFPTAYAQHEAKAQAWAMALSGENPHAVSCALAPVSEDEAQQGAQELTQRLTRDFGTSPVTVTDESVTIDARPLVGAPPDQAAWALAQWVVATANTTGVTKVQLDDWEWTRQRASWARTPAESIPTGSVVATIAP